jgi:hypothetical protein
MSAQSQFDREEDDIQRRYAAGEITLAQYNEEMRDLQRDYRAAAEEAIQEAADRERQNW